MRMPGVTAKGPPQAAPLPAGALRSRSLRALAAPTPGQALAGIFERNGLRAGDKVAVERISEYEYQILPLCSDHSHAAKQRL